MNKKRRNVLHLVLDNLAKLRNLTEKTAAEQIIESAVTQVEEMSDEEQEAQDNLPESLQYSSMYDDLSDNCSDLYEAQSELEMALETCREKETYNYNDIQKEVTNAVNSIKAAIHR